MSLRSYLLLACGLGLAACGIPIEEGVDEPGVTSNALTTGATCDPNNARGVASPIERAMLDTIAFTEGTRGHGKDGYNVTFGYRYFDSCEVHPNIKVCSGKLCSTAAGRYQFLNKTWNGLKLTSFWPEQQELGALELIVRRGVDLPASPMTATEFANALDRLSYEWSSLPPGRYGTPRLTATEIRAEYCRLAGCGSTPMPAPTRTDFVAIEADGLLYEYANQGAGDFTAIPISSEWETATSMGAGADYDEDGFADFVSIDSEYGLELYSGDVEGEYWYLPIELDGEPLKMIGGGADYDRDRHADFIAVDEAEQLLLVRGDGNGSFIVESLDTWAGDAQAIGGGADYSGDGNADFVQLRNDASLWLYLGDGDGGFTAERLELEGSALRLLSGGGDYSGDGKSDLLAIAHDGEGYLYAGRGDRTFDAYSLGSGWERVRFMD